MLFVWTWISSLIILLEVHTAAAGTIFREYSETNSLETRSYTLETKRYSFYSGRGTEINGVSWLPTTDPVGLVYVSHGYGEHMANYDELGSTLASAGLAVFGHDHEGHGVSGGERVNIKDFENYVDDVFRGCEVNKLRYPNRNLPIFIFGQSMGGLITLLAGVQRPNYFRGMILIAPLIKNTDTHGDLRFLSRKMAKVANIFIPELQAGTPIPNNELTRDPEVVNKLDNDPLMWKGSFKAQMSAATFRAVDKINLDLDQVTTPFLVLHGSNDTVVWIEGSKDLISRAQAEDKELMILPDMKHHLVLDTGGQKVIQTVLQWILQRV